MYVPLHNFPYEYHDANSPSANPSVTLHTAKCPLNLPQQTPTTSPPLSSPPPEMQLPTPPGKPVSTSSSLTTTTTHQIPYDPKTTSTENPPVRARGVDMSRNGGRYGCSVG